MSMTYADANTETRAEDAFVPRYARPTKSKKSVKTWMILAPIGAVVLLGSGVAMVMGGGEQAAPAQSTEAAAPAIQTAPAAMTAVETHVTPAAPMETVQAPAAASTPATPAPVARRGLTRPSRQTFSPQILDTPPRSGQPVPFSSPRRHQEAPHGRSRRQHDSPAAAAARQPS